MNSVNRLFQPFSGGEICLPDSLINRLVIDLIFEMGVALWGGVATTVLLQSYVERKYKEGRRYQQEIMQQLAEEKEQGAAS